MPKFSRRPIKSRPSRKKKTRKWKGKDRNFGTTSTAVARVGFSSGMNLLPPRFVAKMRWNKSFLITAGTTDIPDIQSFALTGLFDPEVAVSASLQPSNFDELALQYSHYIVKGAKAKVTFNHVAGSAMVVGTRVQRDTVTTNWNGRDTFMNLPSSHWRIINNNRPTARLTEFYSKKKVYGTKSEQDLQSTPASNPTENYYLNTFTVNLAPGGTQAAVEMVVEIDYIAEWFERAQQKVS